MADALTERRWLAVLNPAAGAGRAARAWPALAAALAAAGVQADLAVTRAPAHACDLVGAAHARGIRRFLAVGGDGTLHEVVNGLGEGNGRSAVAAAPLGTGNDWARGLALPRRPAAIAAMLRAERRVTHDLGRVRFAVAGETRERLFLNVAGAGYDADVLARVPSVGPRALRYAWALAAGLGRYVPPLCHLECGHTRVQALLLVAFAALGRYCGGGVRLAPQAEPGDGLLDLVAIRALRPLAALARLPKLYLGTLAGDPAVISDRGPTIRIEADRAVGVEADGQLLGTTPVSFAVRRGTIDAIVP